MLNTITVEGKVLGRRRPLFTGSVPLPPDAGGGGRQMTLRDLIMCVVRSEVKAFGERQAEQRLQKILSSEEIGQGLAKGKVTMGDRASEPAFDDAVFDEAAEVERAIDVAILGFIDGLYYVFLDEIQQEDLDAPVYIHPESRLTFLRLVALVGG